MLILSISEIEYYDEDKNEFFYEGPWTLQLEHSLISISKWEAKYHKPFLGKEQKTILETKEYIRCMTLNNKVDEKCYNALTNDNFDIVNQYIANKMTATTFSSKEKQSFSREIITSELIYYWMVALQIPFECEKWHLNRLLTLIQICNVKNAKPTKMSKKDIFKRNSDLNAQRKQQLGTTG